MISSSTPRIAGDLLTCLHVEESLWEHFNYCFFFFFLVCPRSACLDLKTNLRNSIQCHAPRKSAIFCSVKFWTVSADSTIKRKEEGEKRWGKMWRAFFFSSGFNKCASIVVASYCSAGNGGFGVFIFDQECLMASTHSIISGPLRQSIVIPSLMVQNWLQRTERNGWDVTHSKR